MKDGVPEELEWECTGLLYSCWMDFAVKSAFAEAKLFLLFLSFVIIFLIL